MEELSLDTPELQTDTARILESLGTTGDLIQAKQSLIAIGFSEELADALIQQGLTQLGLNAEDPIVNQPSFFNDNKWTIIIAILISIGGLYIYSKYFKK